MRYAIARPLPSGGNECIVHGLFSQVEAAEQACRAALLPKVPVTNDC